ncbi:MAG: methanogenesis marker 5 protein [Candidatus Verstraetearchaeota archaeon]|nr:methanogenesis marker 5 protein [Candidatus Verstraetearchaeota archaeon]
MGKKVYIHPPNSLILFDLVKRFGHEPLTISKQIGVLVNKPDLDSPPINVTPEYPRKGLRYVAIEVPSGVRGRLALLGPLIEEAEAAIVVDDPDVSFGCSCCHRTNETVFFLLKQRRIPVLHVSYPEDEKSAEEMVAKITSFLKSLGDC